MGSPGNPNGFLDCTFVDEMDVAGADFSAPESGFFWTTHGISGSFNAGVEINGPSLDSDYAKESGSNKRPRPESCTQPSSKACREKLRRDKLNERFLELSSILEPGKTPKMDKAAILNDAIRVVAELRSESQKLKDSNESLQEKIKDLKAEKNELRDEKQRLKTEKESLEQQIKLLHTRPSLMAPPPVIPAAFAAQGQAAGHKLMMPIIGYPSFPMWQLMPAADVDTSQDPKSCPPVA